VIEYGVTAINADRYMIYIPADRHDVEDKELPSFRAIRCVFDGIIKAWELRKLPDVPEMTEIWDRITTFSVRQAYTDLVYSRDIKVPYTFGTLSLILSFGHSISQNPHVDMVHPNFQFSIVTQKGFFKATHEYQVDEEKRISCSDDLFHSEHGVQAWKEAMPGEDTRKLVKESKFSEHLLSNFGSVLAENVEQLDDQEADERAEYLYPIGTCFSLPGSIIHAGPGCDVTRCILFFPATPKHTPQMYDADTQHNRTSLTACIIKEVWLNLPTNKERAALLHLLAEQMRLDNSRYSQDMIRHAPLRIFTEQLQYGWQKANKGKKKTHKQVEKARDAWAKIVITRFLEHDALHREQSGSRYWESYT
jgi:hypothetical protein